MARSCSRWSRPMPKRWRASCRTTSGPGRCGASSYPGSSVATFRFSRATAAGFSPQPPTSLVPGQLERQPPGAGTVARPTTGGPPPATRQLAYLATEIHPGRRSVTGFTGWRRWTRSSGGLRWPAFPERRTRARRATEAGGRPTSVRRPRPHHGLVIQIAIAAALGCARQEAWVAPDPAVTFAAHRAGDRLVLDRLPSGARRSGGCACAWSRPRAPSMTASCPAPSATPSPPRPRSRSTARSRGFKGIRPARAEPLAGVCRGQPDPPPAARPGRRAAPRAAPRGAPPMRERRVCPRPRRGVLGPGMTGERRGELEQMIGEVAASYGAGRLIDSLSSAHLPNKRQVIEALHHLKAVMYLGYYATGPPGVS